MAKIQLNGRKLELNDKHSLATLLKKYKIDSKKIAVELNGKIVNQNRYKSAYIKDKDIWKLYHIDSKIKPRTICKNRNKSKTKPYREF